MKTTASIKWEVLDAFQCHQRRTEPRPQATCSENLVKFELVVSEMKKSITVSDKCSRSKRATTLKWR